MKDPFDFSEFDNDPLGRDLDELIGPLTPSIIARLTQMMHAAASEILGVEQKWNEVTAKEAVDVGRGLMREYPNAVFCSVGNSPSYIHYAMTEAAAKDGKRADVRYTAFSGHYFNRPIQKAGMAEYRDVLPEFEILVQNQGYYQTYLGRMGLHPEEVVARFEREGRPTVFTDIAQTGTSFTSFNMLARLWARECDVEDRFVRATRVVALIDQYNSNALRKPGDLIKVSRLAVEIRPAIVSISDELGMAMTGNYSYDAERFVAHYPADMWGRPPQKPASADSEAAKALRALIKDAVHAPRVPVAPRVYYDRGGPV